MDFFMYCSTCQCHIHKSLRMYFFTILIRTSIWFIRYFVFYFTTENLLFLPKLLASLRCLLFFVAIISETSIQPLFQELVKLVEISVVSLKYSLCREKYSNLTQKKLFLMFPAKMALNVVTNDPLPMLVLLFCA